MASAGRANLLWHEQPDLLSLRLNQGGADVPILDWIARAEYVVAVARVQP